MDLYKSLIRSPFAILGVLGLTAVLYAVFCLYPKLRNLYRRHVLSRRMVYQDRKSQLSPAQKAKVALAAIYSEQQIAFIDNLRTGIPRDQLRNILEEWWRIADRQMLIEKIEYLLIKGFRFYFPAVLHNVDAPARMGRDGALRLTLPDAGAGWSEEDWGKLSSQIVHLNETRQELADALGLRSLEDIARVGVSGWDTGRAVFLARLGFDRGYLSAQEAWSYIDAAAEVAARECGSWKQHADSYIVGRALWGGSGSDNSGLVGIARYLLAQPKSPWVALPWVRTTVAPVSFMART